MYKLLIVDDEPLVQIGIKSMLDWNELNIEVAGTAVNGLAALNFMEEQIPDIVITDIKMPVMSGLELIRCCRERFGSERPCFIILTSYEDFHTVKEAITYQVTDYLVKLELTPDALRDAILRVTERLDQSLSNAEHAENIVSPFYEKFFIRLLHNLFESEEQFSLQSRSLNLDFHYQSYVCCYGEMTGRQGGSLPMERQLSLFSTSIQMLEKLAGKYRFCYALTLDVCHFALIFCYEEDASAFDAPHAGQLKKILENINDSLKKYYGVSFRCGIGNAVSSPSAICDSYQYSRQAFQLSTVDFPVAGIEDGAQSPSSHASFNIGLFKDNLTRAFEEYDRALLEETLDMICELFMAHPNHYVQVLDGACNILFLSIFLLQDGEKTVSEFFRDNPDGYRSIYRQTSVEQIVSWLKFFERQLCELFENHHRDYKNHLVTNVKKYINQHVTERLSLNDVAAVFGISPNYLSRVFSKNSESGFSEYINICKINEAKRLLAGGTLKIYEVADMLGFESSFYFSKVFKKVDGISPSDYVNGKLP